MLDQSQIDRIAVVLVSPRNPLNIGAVARAMSNFGFSSLTVVAPYAAHWREARSAVGAPELLQNAHECATLADAVAGCSLVVGTGTLTHRRPAQPVILLPDAGLLVARGLERFGRVALVFGPEKHGLTGDDLSYCHSIVEIPTHPRQPSMNLGQAVAVCLYELATHAPGADRGTVSERDDASPARAATSASLDRLAALVEETMQAADYSPASMRQANGRDVRLLLRRLAPADKDIRRLLGLFRRILWRLRARAGSIAQPRPPD